MVGDGGRAYKLCDFDLSYYNYLLIFFNFNYITISSVYLFLTPNSQSVFRAGVLLNIPASAP